MQSTRRGWWPLRRPSRANHCKTRGFAKRVVRPQTRLVTAGAVADALLPLRNIGEGVFFLCIRHDRDVKRCQSSSVVEQRFRKAWAMGSNPISGSNRQIFLQDKSWVVGFPDLPKSEATAPDFALTKSRRAGWLQVAIHPELQSNLCGTIPTFGSRK